MEKSNASSAVSQILFRIIGLLFLISICFVFGSVFFHNTIYAHDKFIVLVTMIDIAVLFVLFEWLLAKIESKLNRRNMIIIIAVYLSIFAVVQIIFAERLRFQPMFDLGNTFNGAINWLQKGSLAECQEYFYYFPNNIGLMCVFRFIFGIVSIFGIHDYYMVASCMGAASMIAMMWAVIAVCRKLFDDKTALRAMFLMLFILPFYIYAAVFYSDVMSVFAMPLIVFFCLKGMESEILWKKILFFLFMGLAAAVGMKIKFTVVIVLIALSIVLLIKGKYKDFLIGAAAALLMSVVVFCSINATVYPKLLEKDVAEQMNTPYLHWIMMGLSGKGSYNGDDYEFTRGFADTELRDNAIKKEVKRRISEQKLTGLITLYEEKTVNCFGDGTFAASDFLDDLPQNEFGLHKYILYDGEKYLNYSSICQGVFLMIMLMMIVSGIKYYILSSQVEVRYIFFSLMFLGIWMFLMLWETTARYFFNHIPAMIIMAVVGISPFVKGLKYLGNLFRPSRQVSAPGK